MKALSELTKDALELPAVQRLTLARILLDLSDERENEEPPDSEAAWEDVIVARMEAVKAGHARASSLEEVRSRLESRTP